METQIAILSKFGRYRLLTGMLMGMLTAGVLAGCASRPQVHSTAQHRAFSLRANDLETHGLAFITPSTVTTQEEDKQALALTFAETMMKERPEIKCVTLSETLGAINRNGLAEAYKLMFEEYRYTGILRRDVLQKVGNVAGSRYVAQLKLAGFRQDSDSRFSVFGLRVLGTKQADIRLFFQIWNTEDGTIAWEASQEVTYAYDDYLEKTITFRAVVEETARRIISLLPRS
ncbi:MAG: hypothetical protein R6V46_08560 [Desulfatiglandaceae bacterium]